MTSFPIPSAGIIPNFKVVLLIAAAILYSVVNDKSIQLNRQTDDLEIRNLFRLSADPVRSFQEMQ